MIGFVMPLPVDYLTEVTSAEIRVKEDYLRRIFVANARVTNPEKGYISAPFVNQLVDLDLQGLASDLVAHKFSKTPIDKVVMIPNSGNPLATTIAERLKKPLVPGRKGVGIPGAWNKPIVIEEETPSFTTGEKSSFIFNGVHEGDKVLLVDDVIAYSYTSGLIVNEFRRNGIEVSGLAVYFAKLFQPGVQRLRDEFNIDPFYVIGIEGMNEDCSVNLSPPHF